MFNEDPESSNPSSLWSRKWVSRYSKASALPDDNEQLMWIGSLCNAGESSILTPAEVRDDPTPNRCAPPPGAPPTRFFYPVEKQYPAQP